MAKQKKPKPSMLGTGLANKAAKAIVNRKSRLAEAEAAAIGKKKRSK